MPAPGNWCLLESKTPKDNSISCMFGLAWKDKKVKNYVGTVQAILVKEKDI